MSKGSLAPLTGVLFAVLAIVGIFVIGGEPPDASEDSPREIINFYRENKDSVIVGGILQTIGATLLVFFGGTLRRVLRQAEGPGGSLSAVVFAGTIILGVALALDASISFALADTIDKLQLGAAQALNALFNYDFLVFALGAQLFLLALGLSLVRHGALPKWIGWVAIVFGVAAITPVGFISLLGMVLLILIMSVLLMMRAGRDPAAPQAA